MNRYAPYLDWIQERGEGLVIQLQQWAQISSGSQNAEGLRQMADTLQEAFRPLGGQLRMVPLSASSSAKGKALHIVKHSNAPFRILLGGHMDTVYDAANSFPVEFIQPHLLRGPGVADMKGGLLVLLTVLEALERTPMAGKIGWEVLINPDEEIGSIGSQELLKECADRCQLGLWFEPAFPDGALVSARKGSATFSITVQGRAAHVGRDFHVGRNAIATLVRVMAQIDTLQKSIPELIINIGYVEGGGAVNIVPQKASCRLNVRMETMAAYTQVHQRLQAITAAVDKQEGIECSFHEISFRPPKIWDEKAQRLFSVLEQCAGEYGLPLAVRPSGGVCDGNLLAAEGLTLLDTLGVIGGNLHTSQEYCDTRSLTQRAILVATLLLHLAEKQGILYA